MKNLMIKIGNRNIDVFVHGKQARLKIERICKRNEKSKKTINSFKLLVSNRNIDAIELMTGDKNVDMHLFYRHLVYRVGSVNAGYRTKTAIVMHPSWMCENRKMYEYFSFFKIDDSFTQSECFSLFGKKILFAGVDFSFKI